MSLISKKIVLILLFSSGSLLYADPYRFVRMIQANGNSIEKVVDLIFEIHHDIPNPATKGSKRSKKLLSIDEKKLYSPSARALLSTLRTLANKKDRLAIRLLWELDEYRVYTKPREPNVVLITLGTQLAKEFTAESKKNIIFESADNYRKTGEIISPLGFFETPYHNQKVHSLLGTLKELLNGHSPLAADMRRAKKNASDANYKLLENIVESYNKELSRQYSLLKKYENKTIAQLMSTLLSQQEQKELHELIAEQTENIELLIKMFAAPEKHVIIYTGGDHADQLMTWLIKNFQFKEAIDVGLLLQRSKLLIPLDSNAFTYLAIDPRISWNALQKESPENIPAAGEVATQLTLHNLNDVLANPTLLQKVIKQYRQMLTDIPNAFVDTEHISLLQYTLVHNYFDAAKILIQNGAKVNDYMLFIAIIKNKPDIVELLLKHGAQPDELSYLQAQKIGGRMHTILDEYKTKKSASKTIPEHILEKENIDNDNHGTNESSRSFRNLTIDLK